MPPGTIENSQHKSSVASLFSPFHHKILAVFSQAENFETLFLYESWMVIMMLIVFLDDRVVYVAPQSVLWAIVYFKYLALDN